MLIVVLIRKDNPATQHYLITRGNKPFRFEGVNPGQWSLRISQNRREGSHRTHRHPTPVNVSAGGEVQVAVQTGW